MKENSFILDFGNILFSIDGLWCVRKMWGVDWLINEMRDLYIDSINLHNGFFELSLPLKTPLYANNVYDIM